MERTIEPRAPLELRVGLAMCIAISVAPVIRRVVAIIHRSQSGPPQLAALDQVFASHAALTLAHILPAMAFVLLIPFVLLRRFSHLGCPQVFLFPLGAVVPFTAYAIERLFGWRMDRTAALALGLEKVEYHRRDKTSVQGRGF